MEWWGYGSIREINIFIENLPDTPLDVALKATRMAEARFLRVFSNAPEQHDDLIPEDIGLGPYNMDMKLFEK